MHVTRLGVWLWLCRSKTSVLGMTAPAVWHESRPNIYTWWQAGKRSSRVWKDGCLAVMWKAAGRRHGSVINVLSMWVLHLCLCVCEPFDSGAVVPPHLIRPPLCCCESATARVVARASASGCLLLFSRSCAARARAEAHAGVGTKSCFGKKRAHVRAATRRSPPPAITYRIIVCLCVCMREQRVRKPLPSTPLGQLTSSSPP